MATQYSNDIIQGHRVLKSLDTADLPAGEHKFMFQLTTNAISQWQYMPVIVFKGQKAGKRIVITAGVHGDEYNGVLAAQQTARELINKDLAGTITIIPTINLSGMLRHSRYFFSADPDSSPTNLNRFFPGDENGSEASRYLYTIWNLLLKPNADLAIDLHSQTSGTTYPLYVFSDFRLEQSIEMARLINPDAILNDPGEDGVLETIWNKNNIPSITIEVGMGRYTDQNLINRTVKGIFNIFKHYQMIEGATSKLIPCLEGNHITNILANKGGLYYHKLA